MKIKRKPDVSQCMIVKNEERNIERALSWAKDIVNEQIVVDTGSTDRTVEIARAMGAKVYFFEWIDDFAAAKNYAIEQASGEWIFFLDADEYFPPEDAKKLLPYLRKIHDTRYNIVITNWMQMNDSGKITSGGTQTRIFRNLPGLRYRGRIHEDLIHRQGELLAMDACDELAIFHTGYAQSVNGEGQKGKRNIPLILRELEEDPENWIMMGYLGDSYQIVKEMEEAEKWYYKAIDHMPEKVSNINLRASITYWRLLMILADKNEEEALVELYHKAVAYMPQEADFDYVVGKYYVKRQNFSEGAKYLEQSLKKIETYGNMNKSMATSGKLQGTWELLALCYYQQKQYEKCVSTAIALLKEDPYLASTLTLLISAFYQNLRQAGQLGNQTARSVAGFLGKLYDFNSVKDRLFLIKMAMAAGYQDLVEVLRTFCSQAELEALERSMEQKGQ